MSTTKHTALPWKYLPPTRVYSIPTEKVVTRVPNESDAELIVTAVNLMPEMEKAIVGVLPLLKHWYDQRQDHLGPWESSCGGKLEQLLTKLRGVSQPL